MKNVFNVNIINNEASFYFNAKLKIYQNKLNKIKNIPQSPTNISSSLSFNYLYICKFIVIYERDVAPW